MKRCSFVPLLSMMAVTCSAGIGDVSGPISPHENSIANYRPKDDCAWIKEEALALTDRDDERDKLGQCHKLESSEFSTGIIELACGEDVTIAGFGKACADTTRDKCSLKCSNYLKRMNKNLHCWSTVATMAVPKGFPLQFMCDWRTGCGINEFNGLQCTANKKSFGLTTSFGFELTFDGTLANIALAVAESLGGINVADVEVLVRNESAAGTSRRLTLGTYDVTIETQTKAEADVLAAAAQKPAFTKHMSSECTSKADAADCDRSGQAAYAPGDCVLNGSPDKTNCNGTHFNLDLYVKGDDGIYTTHTESCVIGNNLNWMSNSDTLEECQALCDKEDKCKAIEFGVAYGGPGKGTKSNGDCTADATSCSGFAVSSVTAAVVIPPMGGYVVPSFTAGDAVVRFHSWSPMKKDEKWDADPDTDAGKTYLTNVAGISVLCMIIATLAMLIYWIFLCGHNCKCCKRICGCCNQKGAWGGEKVARPLLAIMFLVTLIIMCTSSTGATHFKNGIEEVGDVFGKVAVIFDKLEAGVENIATAGDIMVEVGVSTSTQGYTNEAGTGTGCSDKDAGDLFADLAKVVKDASVDLKDSVAGSAQKVRDMQKQITEDGPPMIDAIVLATIVLFVPWALFGLIGVGLGSKAPRMSDCFLNAVAALGLLILWIIAIMLAVELAVGVVLSDFCFSDPLVAIKSLVDQHMDGSQAEMVNFYLDCGDGVGNSANTLMKPTDDAVLTSESLMVLTNGVAGRACSNVTMQKLYNPGTGAISLCDDALDTVKTEFACESMNPLFVSLTHDAICTDVVSGLLALFNTQVIAAVFMLFTLHYASFVRPYMNTKEKKPKGAGVAPMTADAKATTAPPPQEKY